MARAHITLTALPSSARTDSQARSAFRSATMLLMLAAEREKAAKLANTPVGAETPLEIEEDAIPKTLFN